MNKRHVMKKLVLVAVAAVLVVYVVATLATASTTGIISGAVTDAKGTRLSGVNIEVKGLNLTTVTDDKGFFVITNVPPGNYEVVASMVGYKDGAKSDLAVMMDSTAKVSFVLEESVTQEKEATVSAVRSLLHPDVVPSLYVVSNKQEQMTRTQPSALYQVPAIVTTQPGVTADADGYPHIRGGRSQQIGYMLEGIPVTEPTTNGFGTNLVTLGLSKMQVYTGGYRAEYGNAISGVFNEIKKTGRDARGGGMESLYGAMDFRGSMAEFGDVAPNGLDYYVGAYVWHTTFERQYFNEADVADTIGKFTYPLGGNDKLTFLTTQGTAKYQLPSVHTMTDLGVPTAEENDHGHQGYKIHSLTWSHNFNSSSFLTVRPYMFHNWYIVDGVSVPWEGGYGYYNDVYSKQRGLQVEYTNQTTAKHLIKTGVNAIASDNMYRGYSPYMGATDYDYTSRIDTMQLGLFAQDQIKFNDKWQVELGARYDSMKYNKAAAADMSQRDVSPRFGLTFNPTEKSVWRFSWGKYMQFSPTYMMDRVYTDPSWNSYREGNPTLNPERSESYDLGYERQLSKTLVVRATPFYRKYTDLLQSQRVLVGGNPVGPREFISSGLGKTTGLELFAQKKVSNNWDGWLSCTWMRAIGNSSGPTAYDPNVQTYVDWDQRHTLAAVASYHKGPWAHNVQLQYNSGLPYSDGGAISNTERMDSNTVVNYGLTYYLPEGSRIGQSLHLDVFNLFNVASETHQFAGEPDAWVSPRFVNVSLTKKF